MKSTADPSQHQAEQTAAIIPRKLQPVWTKYIPSVQPNIIEYEEGTEPINYKHKVHWSPSGPNITPSEVHIPPPSVNTVQPPRVEKGGPSSNLRSRGNKNPRTRYALTSQCQKTGEANLVTHQISGVAQEYRHLIKSQKGKFGKDPLQTSWDSKTKVSERSRGQIRSCSFPNKTSTKKKR